MVQRVKGTISQMATDQQPDFIPVMPAKAADSGPDFIPISATPAPQPMGENHPILQAIASHVRDLQNSFDQNTTTSLNDSLVQTGLKRVVGTLASPIIH